MLGISTQQPTVLFAALLAAAFACMRSEQPIASGVLLGLVTAKPQFLLFVAAPVSLWVSQDWGRRRALPTVFFATSAALTSASFVLQPSWFSEWIATVRAYATYAGDSIPMMFLGHRLGLLISVGLAVIGVFALWRVRTQPDEALAISITTALVATPFQPYNAMLLIPVAVLLFRESNGQPPLSELIARLSLVEIWAFPVLAILIEFRFPSTGALLYRVDGGLIEVLVCSLFAAVWQRNYRNGSNQPSLESPPHHDFSFPPCLLLS